MCHDYLGWFGIPTRAFNVGKLRRKNKKDKEIFESSPRASKERDEVYIFIIAWTNFIACHRNHEHFAYVFRSWWNRGHP